MIVCLLVLGYLNGADWESMLGNPLNYNDSGLGRGGGRGASQAVGLSISCSGFGKSKIDPCDIDAVVILGQMGPTSHPNPTPTPPSAGQALQNAWDRPF